MTVQTSTDHLELRWRVTGTGETWSTPKNFAYAEEISVNGLDANTLYDFECRAVSACGAKSDWANDYSFNTGDFPLGAVTVSQLATEVAFANTSAAAANAQLADIANDNILSPAEKPTVMRDYAVITSEQAGIDSQATAYAVTTEKTAYDNAVSALTSYLAGLTTPTAWNNKAGNTTIVGTTFRSNFNLVYTTRQTLLNKIYAGAKAKADAAQSTATSAQTTATQAGALATSMAVVNGGFDALPAGYGWTADSGTGWITDTSGATPGVGPNGAKRAAGAGANTGAYRNNGVIGCQPGQVVKAQALFKTVSFTGNAYVYISWLNAALGEIGTSLGNIINTSTTAGSYAVGAAPTGAVYARVCLAYSAMTAGTVYADNVMCTQQPSSMDEVPDSSTRYAAMEAGANKTETRTAADFTGRGYFARLNSVDFSDTALTGRHLGNISDYGGRFAAVEGGANKTETRTAADTAKVNGVAAASISPIAGLMPAQVGADATGSHTAADFVGRGYFARLNSVDFSDGALTGRNLSNIADTSSRFAAVQAGADKTSYNAAKSTVIPDTRATNQLPSWYRANYPAQTVTEFKQRTAIAAPGTATYVSLCTQVAFTDSTGAAVVQTVSASDGIYVRKGAAGDASWGAWYKSYDSQNKADLAAGDVLNPSLGYIADGGGRYGVHQVDSNGLAIIDFSQAGQINKNLGNIADTGTRFAAAQALADRTSLNTAADTAHVNGATAAAISDGAGRAQAGFDSSGYLVSGRNSLDLIGDGSTYYRMPASNMDGNKRALIDFSQTTHVNKSLDFIGQGTYFQSVLVTDMYVTGGYHRIGIGQPGSGIQIGDQRNLKTRTVTNIPARVPTTISYSSTAGAPATATISVGSFTILAGSVTSSYNASSVSETSSNSAVITYYLYIDDPNWDGGSKVLHASTNVNDIYTGDGYIYIGGVIVTYPPTGGTGGSGSGSGSGGGCVCTNQWMPTGRACDVVAGDLIEGAQPDLINRVYKVIKSRINDQPCWNLITESGASVSASDSTPMTRPDGSLVMFPDMMGEQAAVMRDGVASWETVTQMHYIGLKPVNQISIGGNCYWAGDEDGVYISTHNNISVK